MGYWAWEQGSMHCTLSSTSPLGTARPGDAQPRPLTAHPCLTCRHEEDARTQDDVVACLVKLACGDAEATHEEQDHTQDREDTRGPHGPCGT